jgi:very-short-patch-repair endonuclease
MPPRRERNDVVLRARALRRDMTLPEGLLWRELRKRPGGFKFRRQHPVGRMILDFYCPAVRLAIEVDGIAHDMGSRPARDGRRDAWLAEQGIEVWRLRAADVLGDLDAVVSAIVTRAQGLPLHHAAHGSPPHDFVAGRN